MSNDDKDYGPTIAGSVLGFCIGNLIAEGVKIRETIELASAAWEGHMPGESNEEIRVTSHFLVACVVVYKEHINKQEFLDLVAELYTGIEGAGRAHGMKPGKRGRDG